MQQKPRLPKESKFVSVFSDSKPDSDISFRDAAEGLLKQSAERYMVGVDNLSISMDGFSMVDQTPEPEVLLEVILLQHFAAPTDALNLFATWRNFPADFRYTDARSFQLTNDGANITTFADIIMRLNGIAAKVTENLKFGSAAIPDHARLEIQPSLSDTVPDVTHLRFELNVTGQINVYGSRLFWATHMLHIPIKKYQRIFLGNDWRRGVDQRIISVSPFAFIDGFGGINGIVSALTTAQMVAGGLTAPPFVIADNENKVHSRKTPTGSSKATCDPGTKSTSRRSDVLWFVLGNKQN